MQAFGRILKWISHGAALLGAAAILLMMIQIVLDVVMRNLFEIPVPMTTTVVAKWYMVACAFLPLAMTELLNRHIAVEAVYSNLPARARRIVGGLACLIACVVATGMVRPFWFESLKKFEAGSFIVENGAQLPVWQAHFFLPFGFAIFALVLFWRTVSLWTGIESGMNEAPIDDEPQRGADAASEGV